MEAYIGYAILFIAFCVLPLVAVGVIFFVIRAARKKPSPRPQPARQPAVPQAQPTQQPLQAKLTQLAQAAEQAPDLRAQMRSNQAAPATVSKSVGKPIAPSSIKGSAGKIAPVYLTLSSQPSTILRGMDELVAKTRTVNAAGQRWKWMPRLGFIIGLGMMAIDLLLFLFGYPSCVFSVGGLAIWVAAFVFSRALKRQQSSEFPAGYQTARQIIQHLAR